MASWTISPRLLGCFRIERWNHWSIWIFPRKYSTKPLLGSNQSHLHPSWFLFTWLVPRRFAGVPWLLPFTLVTSRPLPRCLLQHGSGGFWEVSTHSASAPSLSHGLCSTCTSTPNLWALPHSGSSRTRYSLVSPSFLQVWCYLTSLSLSFLICKMGRIAIFLSQWWWWKDIL